MSRTLRADRKHAIVIGGSMAGLLAARVLSDHFGRVGLIERDALPVLAEQRRGVPQGRHTHGLLASGRNVLEKLFPGISEALLKAGAVALANSKSPLLRPSLVLVEQPRALRFPGLLR